MVGEARVCDEVGLRDEKVPDFLNWQPVANVEVDLLLVPGFLNLLHGTGYPINATDPWVLTTSPHYCNVAGLQLVQML
jgi:hypothetical protein